MNIYKGANARIWCLNVRSADPKIGLRGDLRFASTTQQSNRQRHAQMQLRIESASIAEAELLLNFSQGSVQSTIGKSEMMDDEVVDQRFQEEQEDNLKLGRSKSSSYSIGNLLLNGNLTCRTCKDKTALVDVILAVAEEFS